VLTGLMRKRPVDGTDNAAHVHHETSSFFMARTSGVLLKASKWVLASALLLAAVQADAAERHSVQGIILKTDPGIRSILVSCAAIPGYMEAMVMPFRVRGSESLTALVPGTAVRFTMVEAGQENYAENLQVIQVSNYESEPTEAARLTFLHRMLDPAAAAKIVRVGEVVPDFVLTDQAQQVTHLSQFRGKVVALTFTYSRCPNPNYCFRLSNNLSRLERRFRSSAGRDLILITIVIAPDQDRGKALEEYADTWKADPALWRFLTGSLADVRAVAELFGADFWDDDGYLTHTFHTAVIDRDGNLAANLEGNQFTAEQLGDLVETVMQRPVHHASVSSAHKVQ
jgi:protein SCO1/2